MKNSLLSIIIPAYNAEKYVQQCLESVKTLLMDKSEIIVINDGSNDNTADVVNKCSMNDDRIRLVNTVNGGVSRARNRGLDEACGKYIMFLDADDFLLPSAFDKVTELIKKEEYEFIAFSSMIIEEDGREWHKGYRIFTGNECSDKNTIDCIMYADSLFNECWGKIFYKDIIDNNRLRFPECVPVGEDLMFVMKYYSYCTRVLTLNIPLVGYRQHGSSAMHQCDISKRMKYTEDIFNYSIGYLPNNIRQRFYMYNLHVLTNLCREYSKYKANRRALIEIYSSDMSKEVVGRLKFREIPFYKKLEFIMMKYRMATISAPYYHLKARM